MSHLAAYHVEIEASTGLCSIIVLSWQQRNGHSVVSGSVRLGISIAFLIVCLLVFACCGLFFSLLTCGSLIVVLNLLLLGIRLVVLSVSGLLLLGIVLTVVVACLILITSCVVLLFNVAGLFLSFLALGIGVSICLLFSDILAVITGLALVDSLLLAILRFVVLLSIFDLIVFLLSRDSLYFDHLFISLLIVIGLFLFFITLLLFWVLEGFGFGNGCL